MRWRIRRRIACCDIRVKRRNGAGRRDGRGGKEEVTEAVVRSRTIGGIRCGGRGRYVAPLGPVTAVIICAQQVGRIPDEEERKQNGQWRGSSPDEFHEASDEDGEWRIDDRVKTDRRRESSKAEENEEVEYRLAICD